MTHLDDERIVEEQLKHVLGMPSKFLEKKNWVEYIIRTTLATLRANHARELEEVRREERNKVAQEMLSYQNESGNSHIDIEWFAQCLFTPTPPTEVLNKVVAEWDKQAENAINGLDNKIN